MLPDVIIGLTMAFANYGAAKGESACPAAHFASVSKRWKHVYDTCACFRTNQLVRVLGWTITYSFSPGGGGAGNVETIVDSWDPPIGSHTPARWWTSGLVFKGGRWRGRRNYDARGGPFDLLPGCPTPPFIQVTLLRPIRLRAIAIAARNRPRKIRLLSGDGSECILNVRPPSQLDQPELGLSIIPIHSDQYMDLVAMELPQGSPPSLEAVRTNSALPVVLPEPLVCDKRLCIYILQSHERGWVGINQIALFE